MFLGSVMISVDNFQICNAMALTELVGRMSATSLLVIMMGMLAGVIEWCNRSAMGRCLEAHSMAGRFPGGSRMHAPCICSLFFILVLTLPSNVCMHESQHLVGAGVLCSRGACMHACNAGVVQPMRINTARRRYRHGARIIA
jgi:hypothetical protein